MSVNDNKRYQQMELVPGEYAPQTDIDYPTEDPLSRIMPVVKVRDIKVDETYPFLDDSFGFKMRRNLAYFIVQVLLRAASKCIYGLKFEGRSVLRKYRKQFKAGIITVSNHCFRWDGAVVANALNHRLWIPMLPDLFTGKDNWYLTHFGGIPLSDGSLSASRKFNAAFDEHHRRGGWVHVFAEARSWLFYKPLRPFQKGAFTWAYKWNCPILPISISFRERKGIYKLFGNQQTPLVTVRIGEPIFPDLSVPRKDEVERLTVQTHAAICKLAGIVKNPWPAIWND